MLKTWTLRRLLSLSENNDNIDSPELLPMDINVSRQSSPGALAASNECSRPIPLKNSLMVRGASAGLQRDKWICKLFEGSTSASFPISALELPMQVLASPPVTSIGT
jgi:hypothetical protein